MNKCSFVIHTEAQAPPGYHVFTAFLYLNWMAFSSPQSSNSKPLIFFELVHLSRLLRHFLEICRFFDHLILSQPDPIGSTFYIQCGAPTGNFWVSSPLGWATPIVADLSPFSHKCARSPQCSWLPPPGQGKTSSTMEDHFWLELEPIKMYMRPSSWIFGSWNLTCSQSTLTWS